MRILNSLGVLAALFASCSTESTIVNLRAAAFEHFQPLSLIGVSTEAKAASSGPASLEAYCAQANAHDEMNEGRRWASYVVGQPVKADWLEFGVFYDGWIIGINKDGTYNVHYEMDDMIERGVKVAHLKPRKVGPKNLNPKHDPACELKDDVKTLNEEIDQANEDIARWSSERFAKNHGSEAPADGAATDAVDQQGSGASPSVLDKANRTHVDSSGNRRGPRFSPTPTSPSEDWKQSETRLKEVLDGIQKVDDEVDKIAEKKVDLDKKGSMDAELGAAIDAAVEFQNRVKDKAKALKKAVTDAYKAQTAGIAAAATGSKEEQEEAQAKADAADAKVEGTLQELQSDFHQVRQNAQKFNKEVAPNSVKWWRFRYEYSYMEAMIMLAVVPIMVLYKYIYGCVRGHSRGMVKEKWFAGLLRDIQSMHLAWLQFAAGEMFVCFLVAITVWLMFTFRMFDWLVVHVHDDNVHIPTTPEHYQLLAMNICMQLGLALLAYHMLVYSVVTATVLKFDAWEAYEKPPLITDPANCSTKSFLQRSTTLMGGPFEFSQMKDYWMEIVEKYPHFKEKLETIQPLDKHFPFGEYLSVNVRLQTDDILQFTWQFWLCAWFTFGIFMLLHRFAQMAYVRIMLFFSVVLLLVLLGMVFVVRATTKRMLEGDDGDKEAHELERQHFTHWISLLLQFVLFFLCYGFTRMVTAPWLWHIYFYNVLVLTVIFGCVMVAFVLYLAPLIPAFYAAMSIPPNITEEEVDRIVHSMHQHHHHHLNSSDGSPGSKQAHAQSFDSG